MKIKEIFDYINEFAPFCSALSFDNCGLIIGDMNKCVEKIGVCLDITDEAVDFAKQNGIGLIICHHPVIFNPLKSVLSDSVTYKLIENGISVIAAHTNLDMAKNGVCETLCDKIDAKILKEAYLPEFPNSPLGRIAELENEFSPIDFAKFIKENLNCPDVRFCGDNKVKKIGIFNGAGADLIPFAVENGADSVLTSEVKQHEWIWAKHHNINVFDAGHFCTENVIVEKLTQMINYKFGSIAVKIEQSCPYFAI